MCWKIWITLLADPPAIKMAKHSRKLPAAICVPGIFGWLLQVKILLVHFGLRQVVVTTAIVPSWRVLTCGPSALQIWQNWKSINSWVRNTTCFGWVRRLSSVTWTLKWRRKKYMSSNCDGRDVNCTGVFECFLADASKYTCIWGMHRCTYKDCC